MYLIDKFMNLLGFEKVLNASHRRVNWRWKVKRETIQPQPKIENNSPIDYLMNDATTPDLVKTVTPPIPPVAPKFSVKNYMGGGFPRDSVEANAANCYVTITNTLNFYNKFSGRDGIKPLTNWARASNISVIPRSGVDLNAFYNGSTLQFFYYSDQSIKRIVYTADSTDIVSHELGHAILDAFRPDTWNAASLEVWSFHEAFGDITALLHIMTHDEILIHALNECGNDISKPSVMTRLAEDVGRAIYTLTGPNSGRSPEYLRSAINDFKYTDPTKLPKEAPANLLAAECHSFARIFVGAYYDFLVSVYNDTLSLGQTPLDSLKHARDVSGQYLLRAIQNVPLNMNFYDSMGRTLFWVAKNTDNGRYYNQMRTSLFSRKIVSSDVKALSVSPIPNDGETIVKILGTKSIKLSEHFTIRAMADNPLYEVEIEIPMEEAYLYDNEKNVIDSVTITEEEAYCAAQDFINYLHSANAVGDTSATPFEVKDGKLVRTYLDCCKCRNH